VRREREREPQKSKRFSYPDLIEFPYLVDTTERGDRE
jgi:hypothetical protein